MSSCLYVLIVPTRVIFFQQNSCKRQFRKKLSHVTLRAAVSIPSCIFNVIFVAKIYFSSCIGFLTNVSVRIVKIGRLAFRYNPRLFYNASWFGRYMLFKTTPSSKSYQLLIYNQYRSKNTSIQQYMDPIVKGKYRIVSSLISPMCCLLYFPSSDLCNPENTREALLAHDLTDNLASILQTRDLTDVFIFRLVFAS
jgi:hypothetical protein